MVHDPSAIEVIQDAVAAQVVRAGGLRMRLLVESDEVVALAILDALERNGLLVVRGEQASA